MKKFILFTCTILCCSICLSQRIVNNILIFDIDDSYNEIDTVIAKNNLFDVKAYRCSNNEVSRNDCKLYSQKTYDKSGQLIKFIKGTNLEENKVDYVISYQKISDSLFQATVKYPADSREVPSEFYVDTVIKGTPKRVCLYKSDENRFIHVRSVYSVDGNGTLKDIKRYDLDDKLVHIYYPLGDRKPKKEWSDVSVSKHDSTVIYYSQYEENEFTSYYVYNKNGKLAEIRNENKTYSNGSISFDKMMIVYNSEGQQIIRTRVGENNIFISEERLYYNENRVIKHTEDDNLSDSMYRMEKIFNAVGQLVLYKSYNRYSGSTALWKFYYDNRGLLTKDEYLLDEKPQLSTMYSYR